MVVNRIESSEKPGAVSRWHGFLLAGLLCAGFALSTLLFVMARGWEQDTVRADFELLGQGRTANIERECRTQMEVLRALGAFLAVSKEVTREEFAAFTAPLLQKHERIYALEWVPRIAGPERAAYEDAARRDGFADFHLTEKGSTGALAPASQREEYYPVYFVEPYEGNEAALGFDNMGMQSPRLDALFRARDTGEMAATARITLVQNTEKHTGIVVFLPVYRKGTLTDSVDARRKNLEGFAVAAFPVDELLREDRSSTLPSLIDCHLFDMSASADERFLTSSPHRVNANALELCTNEAAAHKGMHYENAFDVAGRHWELVCTPAPAFLQNRKTGLSFIILIAGMVITVLLTAYAGRMLRDLDRSRELAVEQARARRFLEGEVDRRKEAEESLRTISSRYESTLTAVSDIIMEVNVQGLYTWANPAAIAFFGEDVVGKEVRSFLSIAEDDCEPLHAIFDGIDEAVSMENWQIAKDQEAYLLAWRCHALRDHAGEVIGAVLSARDVTEQRKSEDGLRASETKLRHTNRALVTISECNQALVRASGETELIQSICHVIVQSGEYGLAWVGYAQDDEQRTVQPVAWAGADANYMAQLDVTWADVERGQGLVGSSIREQRPALAEDIASDARFQPWRAEVIERGYTCAVSLPLIAKGRAFGALTIYSDHSDAVDANAVKLLSELANDLAYGISALRTRAELAQSMKMTQMLARFPDENPNAVLRVTSEGILLYANKASAPVLSAWQCEVGQALPEEWRARIAQSYRQGIGAEVESPCGDRIFSFNLVPVSEAGYVNTYGIDITGRKRAEEALLASESRFRVMFESAGMGIALVDLQGRPLKSNQALHGMLGYDEVELANMTYPEFTHPDDVNLDCGLFEDLLENRIERYQIEKRFIRKDGHVVWGRLTVSPMLDVAGNLQYAIGMVEDITAYKQADGERVRLVMAIESAAEIIVVTDTAGTIEYVNPAFERITGYAREDVLGKNPRLLKSGIHDKGFYTELWQSIRSGEVWKGQFTNKTKDGRLYNEVATISPVRDAAGKIVNYVAVKRDITREIELEEQLRRTQKMEAIGTLAGGIAHDFNNILQSVLGFAEVAKSELSEVNPTRVYLDEILTAGQRARDLVTHILAFSRQSGSKVRPMKIQSILKEIRGLLRGTIPSTIEIDIRIATQCGPVLADPTCIHQIVMNLCTNAYHSMRETGGRLEVCLDEAAINEEQAAACLDLLPGDYARLTVSDTGIGMEPSIMERIFDPYFTTKKVSQGSGLGLSVVLGIVKELKGSISVESTVGEGSRFEILLPICLKSSGVPDGERSSEFDLSKALRGTERILLVDDEESILRGMRAFLTICGYEVSTCANGLEALELVRAKPDRFDVVVTDQTMPLLTGMQLAAELLRLRPELPVILCTGYSELVDEASARAHGLRGFVAKPFTPRALTMAIRHAAQDPLRGAI